MFIVSCTLCSLVWAAVPSLPDFHFSIAVYVLMMSLYLSSLLTGYHRPDTEAQVTIYRDTGCCRDDISAVKLSEGNFTE